MSMRSAPLAVLIALVLTTLAPAGPRTPEPPVVTVLAPNGGEVLTSGLPVTIAWTATDNSGIITSVSVYVSFDGGAHWDPLLLDAYHEGQHQWFVHNRPTSQALVRVTALDPEGLTGEDVSDDFFTIVSGAVGRVPTTLRDFDLPGSQPLDVWPLSPPDACYGCHGFYDPNVEPVFNYYGSMMAYASTDPLFKAAFDIARMDAPESGDLCLRCHFSAAWLAGRSQPTDGSQVRPFELTGVSCDLCHRMVDPFYEPGVSPAIDWSILAALRDPPLHLGDAMFVVDPDDFRKRGPYDDAFAALHDWLPSPFHREAALCGTCHDLSNPVFTRQPDGTYAPNPFNQPAPGTGVNELMPEQRTYSEWFFSAFNTPEGVYAPQFGGNRLYVSTCQHCHMPAVTGKGCVLDDAPVRHDLARHDFAGGSTWMLGVMLEVDPQADPLAIQAGINKARYMLQNAASIELSHSAAQLFVKVTNYTGHKLPTGYPEGRRMWLNVRFYDASDVLLAESAAYDPDTATLTEDPAAKVYEARLGISPAVAALVGLPAGTEFHLVLNSMIKKDNRIPPLGFSNAAYEWFGMPPIGATYADGQNWDLTAYDLPVGAVRAEVRLYYQTASREYIEFLRDEGIPGGAGDTLYALWAGSGKSPPELMASAISGVPTQITGDVNCDGVVDFDDIDPFVLALTGPAAYALEYPNCERMQADCDADGDVDFDDIDPFVALLGS